jgi:hypothetical protein
MKKVISFSLWGNSDFYCIGAIRNSEIKKNIFKDWEMWVYHDNTVPKHILESLEKNGVKLIYTEGESFEKSTWRFYPISEPDVDFFISRDTDSRISIRDEVAVNEWISSGKDFHIIRDHPVGHNWKMNAGMWGAKGQKIEDIKKLIKSYLTKSNPYNRYFDQYFLGDVIYPLALNSLFSHDEYFGFEPFSEPIKRDRKIDDFAFIGECIDINENSMFSFIPGDQRSTIIERYKI